MYRNSTEAFYSCLDLILINGQKINTRGEEVIEILSQHLVIEKPWERVIVAPHRENSIFATIAEAIWVIAGRNDLEYLSFYLPIAAEFSDDGKTWRAGYGKRLRNWSGKIDQVKEILNIFLKDRNTRRGVMSIFNPSEDFIESKDIPCNNWIQFLVRNEQLLMNIAVRSNDIVWGFSGINLFEWSVLQEMMAFWLGASIGHSNYFIGSLHLYKRHYERASKIIQKRKELSIYDFGFNNVNFGTRFQDLENTLGVWFEIENKIRSEKVNISREMQNINDEFLRLSLQMVYIYNCYQRKSGAKEIFSLISDLPICDFKIAAFEFFFRQFKSKDLSLLTKQEVDFFKYYWDI
ncbi:MAG: thymidylate synthase [Anaerolineaceae bacterium]|jgi:thymidylate synthase